MATATSSGSTAGAALGPTAAGKSASTRSTAVSSVFNLLTRPASASSTNTNGFRFNGRLMGLDSQPPSGRKLSFPSTTVAIADDSVFESSTRRASLANVPTYQPRNRPVPNTCYIVNDDDEDDLADDEGFSFSSSANESTGQSGEAETDQDYPDLVVAIDGQSNGRAEQPSNGSRFASAKANGIVNGIGVDNGLVKRPMGLPHPSTGHKRRGGCLCSSLGLKTCCSNGFQPVSKPNGINGFAKPLNGAKPPATRTQSNGAESSGDTPRASAVTIKEALLKWCQQVTAGYPGVNVTNFSTSWSDGIAFCAIVHYYFPNAFDFNRLDPKRRKANFKLGFDLAERLADIPQLLEVEDMVRMKQPDWKCVFTYVQTMYRKLQHRQPTLLPPRSSGSTGSPTGGTETDSSTGGDATSGIDTMPSSPPSAGYFASAAKQPGVRQLDVDDEGGNPFKAEFHKLSLESSSTAKTK